MFKHATPPAGFAAAPARERAPHGHTLPVLIATAALLLSTAVMLTVMMNAARAAHLF
ncbi:MAG: hypothetical protein QOG38_508 [Hyphomicrobiales bacterium]|jgi:hypothetical protein|nr:hypothetical protein [Hyphomicrobiales bacterium]